MTKNIVNITKSAAKQLYKIMEDHKTNAILFSIKGGGCNGFNYKLKPVNEKNFESNDYVNIGDKKLYVCDKSLIHVIGTKIDWKKTIMGESFNFENPIAASSCGCGTSFSSSAFK